jgi:hypothetical protein
MMLIELNSRSVELLPQGLSENVRWPFVVHSQIWPPAGAVAGGAGAAAKSGAAMGAEAGAGAGAAVDAGTGVGADADASVGAATDFAGNGLAVAGFAGACELLGANLLELTAKATATQATDTAPMIHGRRSLCLSIVQLCAGDS